MKKKKDISTSVYRDKDLLRVYFNVVKELGNNARYVTRSSIIEQVLKSPACCFHTSLKYACLNVSALLRGKEISCLPIKRIMYEEIKRRYLVCVPTGEIRRDFSRIIGDIIESPAPCFYLEFGTAFNRINRLIKKL